MPSSLKLRNTIAALFTGLMPFLSPNQQHQSTEGLVKILKYFCYWFLEMHLLTSHTPKCNGLAVSICEAGNLTLESFDGFQSM